MSAKKKINMPGGPGKKGKKKKGFKFNFKINIWTIILIVLAVLFFLPLITTSFGGVTPTEEKIDISRALKDIKEEKVEKVEVENERVVLTYGEEEQKVAIKEENQSFADLLEKSDIDPSSVNYTVVDQSITNAIGEILSILLPVGLMAAFFFFIIRSQSKGASSIFSFGKSKAKLFAKGKQAVNFDDVAGVEDAKKELVEVVDFLKNPGKYRKIGARTPKGVILIGPAGVGKTLLARAVAGEANVPFFSMAGSEFMEMLVGVGASRVRDLFKQAKSSAPSIIFIDEIDAIGRQRGKGMVGGHDEREQTLNQILVEMDGFTPNDKVVVIAATNRGDLLDPALLRPGRFDRRVMLDMPDKEGRKGILKIHARGKKFVDDIDWGRVADRTVGFSGADIENMLNEAAIHAAREDKKKIEVEDVEEAATKVKLGPAKKKLQSEEDRKITAYHEGGHGIVTHYLPKMDPVHRISIVARGMSLGHTLIPPAADRAHETYTRISQQITAILGGRAAEKVVFDEMTSGAANDIQKATKLARNMVINFGMSKLGPVDWGPQVDEDEMGKPLWYEPSNISPSMQEKVDKEVKKIIDKSYKEAEKIVKVHRDELDEIADRLLDKETLDRKEFEEIVGDKPEEK